MDTKEETKKIFLTETIKKIVGYILASLPPLLLVLIHQIRDLIESAISFSLLLVITSVCISGLILSAAYIIHLRRKYNPKLFDKFGICWSKKKRKPFCPICKKPLQYKEWGSGIAAGSYSNPPDYGRKIQKPKQSNFKYWCLHCEKPFELLDDDGSPLKREDALLKLN
jgi:hypothetical protein